mmetsp:Transcript_26162/g.85947  ORF Transcript_26162/g.85947 Transcript_26162/m.85947 type:complete len:272 (-) Transcript_26162:253-1068(-)
MRRIITATYMHLGRKSYDTTGTWASTTVASTSRASSTLDRLGGGGPRPYCRFARTRAPQYSSACCCVSTCGVSECASWIDGPKRSDTSGSAPTNCTISWSLSIPIALSATIMGTSSEKVLCRRYRQLCLTMMLVLLLRSCVELVTDAVIWPLESRSMMMRFLDSCSWMSTTFSTPFTTKYPPGSSGHSPSFASSFSDLPCNTHLLDRSINGMRPMQIAPCPFFPLRTIISLPLVYSTSTVMGAAYVVSRSLHVCGVISRITKSSSMHGLPT